MIRYSRQLFLLPRVSGKERWLRRSRPASGKAEVSSTLWKDTDPDIPILKEAKSEYAKLNPLLWARGNAEAAIRVEHLWDEIAKTYYVDILCGYPLGSFHSEQDSHIFQQICAAHSAVHSQ